MTEWLAPLLHICKVLGFVFSPEVGYTNGSFPWFFFSPSGRFWDCTLKRIIATSTSFPVHHSQSSSHSIVIKT